MWDGYYDVNTDVVRETMRVVTPPVTDMKSVGYYIARKCNGSTTYMLEKVVSGVYKRSAPEDNKRFKMFAGVKIVAFDIDMNGVPEYEAQKSLKA